MRYFLIFLFLPSFLICQDGGLIPTLPNATGGTTAGSQSSVNVPNFSGISGGSSGSAEIQRYFFPNNPNLPLEGPINRNEYITGPNDVFTITVGGIKPVAASLLVSVTGYLLVPDVGAFKAAGKTLAEVENEIEVAIKRRYSNLPLMRDVPIEVAFSSPRTFYIHIAGGVANPGRQTATPLTRIDTVVRSAINGTQNPDQKVLAFGYRPSIRDIRIKHADGTQTSVDITRYYTTGDIKHNPFLQDGDQIYVPTFNVYTDALSVQGSLPYPGTYPYRPGDTLLDILSLCSGVNGLEKLNMVRLIRTSANVSKTEDYYVPDLITRKVANPALQPQDFIYVINEEVRQTGNAYVEGEIQFPGAYPIIQGKTTLKTLFNQAGGARPGALIRTAYIERAGNATNSTSPFQLSLNPKTQDVMLNDKGRLGTLPIESRLYLERELVSNNKLSFDLNTILAPDAPDVYLYDGDKLLLPLDQRKVQVIGEVLRRGYVDYVPGAGAETYIAAAGGKGQYATFSYVIKAGTGELKVASETEIQSGDIVFVDRKMLVDSKELLELDMAKRSQKSQRVGLVASALGVLTATIGIILQIVNN